MKNRRIIIFMPSIEGGGVEKNLFIIGNYLSKKFNNVSLITVSKRFRSKFNKKINFISPSMKFWDQLNRKIKYLIAIILLIKELTRNRNSIVLSFQANIYCLIICKVFFVKNVSRSNSAPSGWSKNIIKRLIFKIFFKFSDKIIVNSFQFKKNLKNELGLNSECIYNPLNIKEIIKKSKKKSVNIFNTKKELKILNIGRLTEQKDQITFLKSLNEIKDKIKFSAVIIGNGFLKEKLDLYIKDNDLSKKVKIINFVENPYPLIKQADIFILTSKFEGLPNVLLESLVLKKFIISSDCPTGPREILLNGKGGMLFNVGNYKQLAEKIIFYYKNKIYSKKMLNRSIKEIKRFDYQKNLEKYFKLLNNIK